MVKNNHLNNVVLLVKGLIRAGITNVVISPGSRNAPFINLFTGSSICNTHVVVDERSAGFIALGLAKETKRPVILVCTSGTASLNYSPAIAEAYYQQLPLLVITADRPLKWLHHSEGQQINQTNVYQNFTAASFVYDTEKETAQLSPIISDALHALKSSSRPVHFNVPINEPLYGDELFNQLDETPGNFCFNKPEYDFKSDEYAAIDHLKIAIVLGNRSHDEKLNEVLSELNQRENVLIVAEAQSNCALENILRTPDLFFQSLDNKERARFMPDILITIGTHILSKHLKNYFRKYAPAEHWHINKFGYFPNTFDCLTKEISADPASFIKSLNIHLKQVDVDYKSMWLKKVKSIENNIANSLTALEWSEFNAFAECYSRLPLNCSFHLGNSMTVRYPEFLIFRPDINHLTNRGTSGIDGSLSTAIGSAKANNFKQHVIVLGDLSFMYDSNALWQEELPKNLKVIILNNGGGGIFDFIPGPSKNKKYERNFIAAHTKDFKYLAKQYEIPYLKVVNALELKTALKGFFDVNSFSILEIQSNYKENSKILIEYISEIKK